MAITVKKKKMTVKTVKAKGQIPDAAEAEVEPEAEAEADVAPIPAAPPQRAGRPRVDGKAYTVSVVFAIIAILMFIGLITIQALELSYYYQPRPVFIRLNAPGGGIAPSPSPAPAPPAEAPSADAE